jgi:hypothetical protein
MQTPSDIRAASHGGTLPPMRPFQSLEGRPRCRALESSSIAKFEKSRYLAPLRTLNEKAGPLSGPLRIRFRPASKASAGGGLERKMGRRSAQPCKDGEKECVTEVPLTTKRITGGIVSLTDSSFGERILVFTSYKNEKRLTLQRNHGRKPLFLEVIGSETQDKGLSPVFTHRFRDATGHPDAHHRSRPLLFKRGLQDHEIVNFAALNSLSSRHTSCPLQRPPALCKPGRSDSGSIPLPRRSPPTIS